MSIRNVNVDRAGEAEIAKEKLALYTRYHFADDFNQQAGSALGAYWTTAVGGAGTVSIPAVSAHGGIVRLDSVVGGAGVDLARLLGPGIDLNFAREPEFWFLFRLNSITGCGFYVGIQASGTEYAWIRFDTALADASFQFASNDNGVTGPTVVSSGVVPVAARWYELRMNVKVVGTTRVVYARLYDRSAIDVSQDGRLLTTGASLISASNAHRVYVSSEAQGQIVQLDLDYFQVFAKRWA